VAWITPFSDQFGFLVGARMGRRSGTGWSRWPSSLETLSGASALARATAGRAAVVVGLIRSLAAVVRQQECADKAVTLGEWAAGIEARIAAGGWGSSSCSCCSVT
jgi:lipid-binding SYLF domain-containing protein